METFSRLILFNPRIKKKLPENYFSPLNVISKAKLIIRHHSSQLDYSLNYREKERRVFEYSRTYDDICSKIIPIIFASRKAIYDATSSFHLLLLFRRAIGKKDSSRKGMKRERRRGKITIRDRVSPL